MQDRREHAGRCFTWALLGLTVFFFGLHLMHLQADFPNGSRWMDWAKYTDEGWYGDAAIRHFQLGHWFVPGDFNPAAALPVWPFLEALVFRFTGVSLLAARVLVVGVFGCTLACAFLLIARTAGAAWSTRLQPAAGTFAPPPEDPADPQRPGNAGAVAAVAVLLLAVSPFCFVISRLAILEPPLVLFTMLALLTASFVRDASASAAYAATLPAPSAGVRWASAQLRPNWLPALLLGCLLPVMVLTKTTAVFLLPAVAWMLFASTGYRWRVFGLVGGAAGLLGAALWLAYFGLLVRPHFLLDYRYLFAANAYTGITTETAGKVIANALTDGAWMGKALYPLALFSILLATLRWKHLRRDPLIVSLVLWAAGYATFLVYHNNLQPRYYLVVAIPLTLLVPLALRRLLPAVLPVRFRPAAAVVSLGLLSVIVIQDAGETLAFASHPEYSLIHAAQNVAGYIADDRRRNPSHSALVLSISGSDLSLMTGLHSICDDFGTLELSDRVKLYRPGWYLAWNDLEDDKMDALTPLYRVQRVAAFPAMDDPDRNLLILYKLEDASSPVRPPDDRRRVPIPRQLQTRVGQQPSTSQLEH